MLLVLHVSLILSSLSLPLTALFLTLSWSCLLASGDGNGHNDVGLFKWCHHGKEVHQNIIGDQRPLTYNAELMNLL